MQYILLGAKEVKYHNYQKITTANIKCDIVASFLYEISLYEVNEVKYHNMQKISNGEIS